MYCLYTSLSSGSVFLKPIAEIAKKGPGYVVSKHNQYDLSLKLYWEPTIVSSCVRIISVTVVFDTYLFSVSQKETVYLAVLSGFVDTLTSLIDILIIINKPPHTPPSLPQLDVWGQTRVVAGARMYNTHDQTMYSSICNISLYVQQFIVEWADSTLKDQVYV